jgi:hypothetical protein
LGLAKELDDTLHVMYDDIDTSKLSEKYNSILSNKELLSEYNNDLESEFDDMVALMDSKANVPTEEIKFNLNKN